MRHRYSKYLPAFILISDIFLLNSTFCINYFTLHHTNSSPAFFLQLISILNITWCFITIGTKNNVLNRPLTYTESLQKAGYSALILNVIFLCALYLLKVYELSRIFFIVQFFTFFALLCLQRIVLIFCIHYIRIKGYNKRKVWLIGDQDIISRVENSFGHHPEYGYNLVAPLYKHLNEYSKQEIKNFITFNKIDEVFICFKEIQNEFLRDILEFEKMGIKVKMISDLQINPANAKLIDYDNFPVIYISSRPFDDWRIKFIKRSFDLAVSSIIMIIGSPFFLSIVIATKLSSRGNIFFRQQRIGKNGKPFYIYKFRSMYIDAEHMGPQLSKDNDPRITTWGRIMRKTRLDELPQFLNVFLGQMSIVGPRPERRFFIEKIIEKAPEYKKLLSVKPGITSIGQVRYGYAENVEQMIKRMKFDLLYLNNQNFKVDFSIIMETVRVVVQGKGK